RESLAYERLTLIVAEELLVVVIERPRQRARVRECHGVARDAYRDRHGPVQASGGASPAPTRRALRLTRGDPCGGDGVARQADRITLGARALVITAADAYGNAHACAVGHRVRRRLRHLHQPVHGRVAEALLEAHRRTY